MPYYNRDPKPLPVVAMKNIRGLRARIHTSTNNTVDSYKFCLVYIRRLGTYITRPAYMYVHLYKSTYVHDCFFTIYPNIHIHTPIHRMCCIATYEPSSDILRHISTKASSRNMCSERKGRGAANAAKKEKAQRANLQYRSG